MTLNSEIHNANDKLADSITKIAYAEMLVREILRNYFENLYSGNSEDSHALKYDYDVVNGLLEMTLDYIHGAKESLAGGIESVTGLTAFCERSGENGQNDES